MNARPNVFEGLGAAFYPEHHHRSTWAMYADLMANAGVSFARLGEFAWNLMEPEDGCFEFDWLDEALELLRARDIGAVLCTPTAAPPIWACERYPDMLPVMSSGSRKAFGSRRYTCPTSESYRDLCIRIADAMARRYGASDRIVAWQIDNEFGHPFCYCDRCRRHFQNWCQARYTTIETFNAAIGTQFWGQALQRFDQIPLPTSAPNPALVTAYHRWFSDAPIDCYSLQADALRATGTRAPVTTNMMITWYGYDHEAMAARLDTIAGDHYSMGNTFGEGFAAEAFTAAYLRGLKPGVNIRYHELQCGRHLDHSPLPGQARWWLLTQTALGADALCLFRWDTSPSGAERDAYGLLKPCVQPGRLYHEIARTGADLKQLKPLLDGTVPVPSEIALLFTFDNHCEFAERVEHPALSGPHGNGYSLHLARHFKAIRGRHVPVDIVYPDADFNGYRCIVAPALYHLADDLARKLETYVANGGTLLLTACSGILDGNGSMWSLPCPGPLASCAGIRILDYTPYHARMDSIDIMFCNDGQTPERIANAHWIDRIEPDPDTRVLATFNGGVFNGDPACTRHDCGRGRVFYLGTLLDEAGYRVFYGWFLRAIGLPGHDNLPPGVHTTIRQDAVNRLLFVSNETASARQIPLPPEWKQTCLSHVTERTVCLAPFDVQCFVATNEQSETGRNGN